MYPGLCQDHKQLPDRPMANASRGINDAEKKLGVARLIYPEEMIHPKVDEHAMMAHIAQYRDAKPRKDDAAMTRAWGPGLKESVASRPTPFYVKTPADCKGKLQVRVEGPRSDAPVNITPLGDGNYTVVYQPDEPGHYKVHVTVDGKHIPGSIFNVYVYEGHVRLYFGNMTQAPERAVKQLEAGVANGQLPAFEQWSPIDGLDEGKRQEILRGKPGKLRSVLIVIDDDDSMNHFAGPMIDPLVQFSKQMRGSAGAGGGARGGGGDGGGGGEGAPARSAPKAPVKKH